MKNIKIITEEITVPGSLGDIYGVLYISEQQRPVPLVILSHGFGGSHISTQSYAEYLAGEGFAAYSFDFCGGGLMGNRSGGTMLEMSVLTEARDLEAVIDHFKADSRIGVIMLFGQSQGGFVSAYTAAQRPEDISALVLEYPAFVLQDDAKKRADKDGAFPEKSIVLGMTIGRKYNEDAVSFDIYDEIGSYTGDVLILHGDSDSIVPLAYSERAEETYASAELIVLPGQGHGFNGDGLKTAIDRETAFFIEHAEIG